ncbi:GNAT family N-acetyltransferase [Thalassotalea psychrophila]|uniref:GNAT family N-acetyltransferase n=1 Tax=Thalassotalea psychrophila TaxID=3065647 RepID=A0ABY9TZF5_9GAMM|nr:GNAT family N-acetyltransferase [Colwelliaceae bacterium SQ149]
MIIREILAKDMETILELNEKSVKVLSPLDKSKLIRLINMSVLSVVVEDENQIAGFLLAFSQGAQYESINYEWFNQNYASFLYIDRIVISKKFRAKGIGSMLYRYALDWASKKNAVSMFAEIDVMPPNEPSLLFHQKFGFTELELLTHNENKIVSLQGLKID